MREVLTCINLFVNIYYKVIYKTFDNIGYRKVNADFTPKQSTYTVENDQNHFSITCLKIEGE